MSSFLILALMAAATLMLYTLTKDRQPDTEYLMRVHSTVIVVRYAAVTVFSIGAASASARSEYSLAFAVIAATLYNTVIVYAAYATLQKTKQVLKYFTIEMSVYSVLMLLITFSASLK